MRRRLLVAALAASLAGEALAADATLALVTPGRDGHGRLLLDPGNMIVAPTANQFKVVLGNGAAMIDKVAPMAGEPVLTVLAFDASGSFRTNTTRAVELARIHVRAATTGGPRRWVVVTFGSELVELGTATDASEAEALLDQVAVLAGGHKVTRLKGFVHDAIGIAARHQPPTAGGMREVVVFTDSGDEGKVFTARDVVTEARTRGVRVHVVEFPGRTSATRLDEMKSLSRDTGGTPIDGRSPGAEAAVEDLARSTDRLLWMDLSYCGVVSTGPFGSDTVSVEVMDGASRLAATPPVSFSQEATGTAVAPCTGAGATSPQVGATAPITATAPQTNTPAPATGTFPLWIVAVVAGSVPTLAFMLGAFRLLRSAAGRSAGRIPNAPPPHPPTAPVPSTAQWRDDPVEPPAPVTNVDPFALTSLPETHLVVDRAPPGTRLKTHFRLTRRETVLGAHGDDGADLVVELPQISGRHASLELFPAGTVFVTDLRSRNGTFVNGRLLAPGERVAMTAGDVLGLSKQLDLRIRQPGLEEDADVRPPPTARVMREARPSQVPTVLEKVPSEALAAPAPSTPLAAPQARQKSKTVYAPVKPTGGES